MLVCDSFIMSDKINDGDKPMRRESNILLRDLILSLSQALDLEHPDVVDHQHRVAYVALSLAEAMGWSQDQQLDLLYGGYLHDIGLLTIADKLKVRAGQDDPTDNHAELGWRILSKFKPFKHAAELVRHHHQAWDFGTGRESHGHSVCLGSHLLNLSDSVELAVDRDKYILHQKPRIMKLIESKNDSRFAPAVVEALKTVAVRECFWLDLVSPEIYSILSSKAEWAAWPTSLDDLEDLSSIFSRIIDFRSPWTATHSAGVAISAEALAECLGLSARECQMLRIAGYLHDLGKLFVSEDILNKPGPLDNDELRIMRAHTHHTFRILETISGLEDINEWASFHHERLNGKGYPFHHSGGDLTIGARIMSVADMFVAISEDRPYRKGMDREKAMEVLTNASEQGSLDKRLVKLLIGNFDKITEYRELAQRGISQQYQDHLFLDRSLQKGKASAASEPPAELHVIPDHSANKA